MDKSAELCEQTVGVREQRGCRRKSLQLSVDGVLLERFFGRRGRFRGSREEQTRIIWRDWAVMLPKKETQQKIQYHQENVNLNPPLFPLKSINCFMLLFFSGPPWKNSQLLFIFPLQTLFLQSATFANPYIHLLPPPAFLWAISHLCCYLCMCALDSQLITQLNWVCVCFVIFAL